MLNLFGPPAVIETEVFSSLPQRFRRTGQRSQWAEANKGGSLIDSFIEGPSFDRAGNLYVVDIPFGRIFRISPQGDWNLVAEYDGEPNGLKVHQDGRIFVADYRNGLMQLDPGTGRVTPYLTRRHSENFKGLNDLVFASNGDLYFTDQGQTGLHDPSGRVYRLSPEGRLDCLIANVPSPNGLVLNPEENVLYVAATRANAVWRMPLLRDGSVSKVGLFFQFFGSSGPDGLAMDEAGHLVVAHASLASAFVLSHKGELLYQVRACTGGTVTNVAFGGQDRRNLYLTESETGSILVAYLPVRGREMYSHMKALP
ncbi:MAG: SMP-30/gluconolactonase/LRE family protein [Thermodesulfobacteriota bacterium]